MALLSDDDLGHCCRNVSFLRVRAAAAKGREQGKFQSKAIENAGQWWERTHRFWWMVAGFCD